MLSLSLLLFMNAHSIGSVDRLSDQASSTIVERCHDNFLNIKMHSSSPSFKEVFILYSSG